MCLRRYAAAVKPRKHPSTYCCIATKLRKKREIVRQGVASIALRTRRDLAQLTLKYPELTVEWLLQTGKFALYNKARELQREWESEGLSSRDQEAATGIG
jgi:hypothetical protein